MNPVGINLTEVVNTFNGIYAKVPDGRTLVFPADVLVSGSKQEADGVIMVAEWYAKKYGLID